MSWINTVTKLIAYSFYTLAVSLVLLEVIFRVLPTAELFSRGQVNAENPIISYKPNQSITYSLGPDFYQVIEKHTNNYGYVSSLDYVPGGKPDLVVIGDSYVEALQVFTSSDLSNQIGLLNKKMKIYPIGISGAALSQYIKFAEFAEKEFNPSAFMFVIVGNDFDESICRVRPKEGNYCYDKGWELKLINFSGFPLIQRIARNSAFARYLVLNVKLDWRKLMNSALPWRTRDDSGLKYAGNTDYWKSKELYADSKRVINEFFASLTETTRGKPTFFVIDGDRFAIYDGVDSNDSFFMEMRDYFILRANNHKIIDMQKVFENDFAKFGQRFDFKTDAHWNERGHYLVAKEVANYLLETNMP